MDRFREKAQKYITQEDNIRAKKGYENKSEPT